jgi:hypothetical protein
MAKTMDQRLCVEKTTAFSVIDVAPPTFPQLPGGKRHTHLAAAVFFVCVPPPTTTTTTITPTISIMISLSQAGQAIVERVLALGVNGGSEAFKKGSLLSDILDGK